MKNHISDYLSAANRDILVVEDGSFTERYVYDSFGVRVSAEFDYATGTHRGEGGENLASDFAANYIKKVWYRSSLTGSSLFAVDKDGEITAHMVYDPWGEPLTETYTDANKSGIDNLNNFTGYAWDEVMGLYYAQNRFYDSENHRFTQEDPAKDGANWYVYVGNNPGTWTDPWGLFRKAGYYTINGKSAWYSDPDKTEFGEDSLAYKSLYELDTVRNNITNLQGVDNFTQASLYAKNMSDIDRLEAKVREIGRDMPWIKAPKIGDFYTISEQLLYSYYKRLGCAVVSGRTAARNISAIIYNSGFQFEETKTGGYIDGTKANAFTHSMWNALVFTDLVKTWGYSYAEAEELAWLASAMHEYSEMLVPDIGWLSNVNMDMHNNEKGIEIAVSLIGNKYPAGLFRIDNYALRIADLAANMANAVDVGLMVRNRYVDYGSDKSPVKWFDDSTFEHYRTTNSERRIADDGKKEKT